MDQRAEGMNILRQFHYYLIHAERWLAATSLLLLIILAFIQILARNFFDTGIPSADTLTRQLVLYVTFFGAALAVSRDRHIKIDICCTLLSAATLRRLYRPTRAIAALVCGLLSDAAIRFWRDEWLYAANNEHWQVLVALVIPVGFILLTAEFTLGAVLGRYQDRMACCSR